MKDGNNIEGEKVPDFRCGDPTNLPNAAMNRCGYARSDSGVLGVSTADSEGTAEAAYGQSNSAYDANRIENGNSEARSIGFKNFVFYSLATAGRLM